jgi:hypothetical protein
MSDESTCIICLGDDVDIKCNQCNCYWHIDCLREYLIKSKSQFCPHCQTDVVINNITTNTIFYPHIQDKKLILVDNNNVRWDPVESRENADLEQANGNPSQQRCDCRNVRSNCYNVMLDFHYSNPCTSCIITWTSGLLFLIMMIFCVGIVITAIIGECIVDCSDYEYEAGNWSFRGFFGLFILSCFFKCIRDTYRQCPFRFIIHSISGAFLQMFRLLTKKCCRNREAQIHIQNRINIDHLEV